MCTDYGCQLRRDEWLDLDAERVPDEPVSLLVNDTGFVSVVTTRSTAASSASEYGGSSVPVIANGLNALLA